MWGRDSAGGFGLPPVMQRRWGAWAVIDQPMKGLAPLDAAALDFLRTAPQLTDLATLTDRFADVAGLFGITHFACLHYAKPGSPLRPRPMFGREVPTWVSRYLAEGFAHTDPGIELLFTSSVPFTWDDLKAKARDRRQLHVFDAAREEGMQDGLLVPVHGAYGDVMGVTLVSDRRLSLDKSEVTVLAALATLYAAQGQTSYDLVDDVDDRPPLTRRERECLVWASRGKSDWEIGKILSISMRTVDVHVTNAKRKLNAANRAQAVIEAWRRGWLIHEDAGPKAARAQ